MMYVGWGFVSFVFYKVATAMLLPEAMNFGAALVGGICAGACIYLQGQLIGDRLWRKDLFGVARIVVLTAGGATVLVWLIVQGFDPDFAQSIAWPDEWSRQYNFDSQDIAELITFEIIAAFPVLLKGVLTTLLFWRLHASR